MSEPNIDQILSIEKMIDDSIAHGNNHITVTFTEDKEILIYESNLKDEAVHIIKQQPFF